MNKVDLEQQTNSKNKKINSEKANTEFDVVIVGGGIIGASIAYELGRYALKTALLEKNPYFGDETSTGNSGVIHCGFDAKGPLEAYFNVEGNKLWQNNYLKHLSIPHAKIDSLVVAFNKEESDELHKLYDRGLQNKLNPDHISIIDRKQLYELEPKINPKAIAALKCTNSFAIDPVFATRALIGAAMHNGIKAYSNSDVIGINEVDNEFEIKIANGRTLHARYVINAAGHYADLIAKKANQSDFELTARRGEYRILSRSEAPKVHNIIFKVPTIHGKGVVVAPTLDGRVLVGPTAEEHVPKADTRLVTREKYDLIGQIGKDIIPGLDLDRTEKTFAGSRPIYEGTNDFLITYGSNNHFINVAGTQSPALSGAPAIALHIIEMLRESGLKLHKQDAFDPDYRMVW